MSSTSLGRFHDIPRSSMNPEQVAVVDSFMTRLNSVPTPFRIFLSSASLVGRLKALSDYTLRGGLLSKLEVEIAVLVVAHRMDAKFVQAAHRRIAAASGLPADAIEAILSGKDPQFSDPRQRAIHRCCAIMLDRGQNDKDFADITSVLGDDGVVEVAAILGFYCTCGFTLDFYEVPPPSYASA